MVNTGTWNGAAWSRSGMAVDPVPEEEHRLAVGSVVLSDGARYWLVVGPNPQIGQNSILIHGSLPSDFTDRRTHWSDDVVKGQLATINPPDMPDEVCRIVAAFAHAGEIPSVEP